MAMSANLPDDDDTDSGTIKITTLPPYSIGTGAAGSYTCSAINWPSVTGASGNSLYSTSGMNGTSWGNITSNTSSNPSSLNVKGDAEFEGKVMINGRNISEFMETIANRLAILVPDPAKLEKHEALKKAYDHYKLLEKLIGED
jgi:hypothetical protein